MKKLFGFLLLGGWAATVGAQSVKYTEYTLPNGLHVILHQDNSNPIVAVSILYHVGSKNEKPNRTGFAHFFEHLLFEGSENIKRGEFDKHVASNGGVLNANTSQDRTYYYELLPSNQLELGLWLESERLLHAKVENEGIETQRQVVKEEKRLRVDNQPYSDAITRVLWESLFKKHPYRWAVIGSMDDLDAATEEDYVSFYKTFYVPNNATLSIAGDLDVEKTKKMIDTYFGSIPKGTIEIPRPNVVEDPITSEIRVDYNDKNAQIPAVIYGYRSPKQTDKDAYVLDIISNVLSNGESSRLTKEVVNKKQLALASQSFLWGLEDYGIFVCFGLTNQDILPATLEGAMDEEIEKLKKDGITQRELDKQINSLEKGFIDEISSMAGIAESLANYHVYYGKTDMINQQLAIYRSITLDDVKRVANKYLNKNQRVVLNVIPSQE